MKNKQEYKIGQILQHIVGLEFIIVTSTFDHGGIMYRYLDSMDGQEFYMNMNTRIGQTNYKRIE